MPPARRMFVPMAFRRISLLFLALALICAGFLPAQAGTCHGLALDRAETGTTGPAVTEPECHGHAGTATAPAPPETDEQTPCPDQACCCAAIVKAIAPATTCARTAADAPNQEGLADPGRPSGCSAPELPPPRA